ncbi:MAG: type II secretion system protein GspF [Deltaproteobacteria bacterium CG11_big_fil_rev_8_21_14_0_20_45_16]|nr:MAG: type II secretion system protein GspF [Deltaproteobacteria bacterium CG11_big_fil_rev_8_21_14_0_20_45_16]
MPQYQYQGFDSSGKSVKGIVTTDNVNNARTQLKREGVYVSSIRESLVGTKTQEAGSEIRLGFFMRISADDMANMTRQLSTLIASHIPLVEALDALTDQIENPNLKAAIARVRSDVNEGAQMYKAMAKFPDIFPDLFVSMIQAGEASGALDVVLIRLADFMEYQSRLRKRVIGALFYPVAVVLFGGGVVLVIFTFVIPQIASIFEDTKTTLPLITRITLWCSDSIINYWWAIVLVASACVWAIRRFLRSAYGERRWDEMKLKIPIFGDVIRMVAVSRFTKTLSTLLRSGISLLASLEVVKNVVGNITIKEAIEAATTNLTEGQGISGPLKRSGQFPPLVTHMISVGERTGELEEMLERVAQHYEYQVDSKIQSFTSLIEPIMIISLASVVAVIVLSVILPMLELNNAAL